MKMKHTGILTTALKTRDAVAETALHSLTHDMGYGNILTDLKREDYWKIELETNLGGRDSKNILIELAEKTRVFVNINKHIYTILDEDSLKTTKEQSDGKYTVFALVTYRDNRVAERALKTLRALYNVGKHVRYLESGVLWIMALKADSINNAQNIAKEIAVTESREQGLLANPHFQNVIIL